METTAMIRDFSFYFSSSKLPCLVKVATLILSLWATTAVAAGGELSPGTPTIVYLGDKNSWIEYEVNKTETEYILDLEISFLDLPPILASSSILSLKSHDSKTDLKILVRSRDEDASFEYIALFEKSTIPFYVSDYTRIQTNPNLSWISLRVVLTRFHLSVSVNGVATRVTLRNSPQSFNFTAIRLGRAEPNTIYASNTAFSTCYRSLSVNQVEYLNKNGSLVSQGNVVNVCRPIDPCSGFNCYPGSSCVSTDNEPYCVETGLGNVDPDLQGDGGSGVPRQPTSTQILTSLNVEEGSKTLLDVLSIELPDGVLTKNVFFNVTRSGLTSLQYGNIVNKIGKMLTIFNYEPARKGNIFYEHNGGENSNDKIVMQMLYRTEFNTFKPGNFVYVPVIINPINDEPVLFIDRNLVVLLEKNSRRPVNSEILTVKDSDNSPEQLKLFVLSIDQQLSEVSLVKRTSSESNDVIRYIPISSFTFQNVLDEEIFIQHQTNPSGNRISSVQIQIQVADEKSFGNKTFLNIKIVEVSLHLINEGLATLVKDSPFVLNEALLSVAVYPESDSLFIIADQGRLRYLEDSINMTIMPSPHSKVQLQVLNHLELWVPGYSFTQQQLRQGKVRLVSQLDVTTETATSYNGVLNIRASYKNLQKFVRMNYFITTQSFDVHVNNYFVFSSDVLSQNLTGYDLSAKLLQPHPTLNVAPSELFFVITTVPEYFNIYLNKSDSNGIRENILLTPGSKFTQEDVNIDRIFLTRKLQALTSVTDQFTFTVKVKDLVSQNYSFLIHVIAIRNANFRLRQDTVFVQEGKETVLTTENLMVSCSFSDNYFFYITRRPSSGRLEVVGTRMRQLVAFTYAELKRGVVSYIHDGSESPFDDIGLSASPITIPLFTSKEGIDYKLPINNVTLTLNISIELVADNKPIVINNKIINTTYNGLILLTPDLLKCHDPDLNQADSTITYIIKPDDPNIKFVNCQSANEEQISTFTQKDIESFAICVKQQSDTPKSESVIRATNGETSSRTDETLITLHIRNVDPYVFVRVAESVFEIEREQSFLINSGVVYVNTSVMVDPFKTVIMFEKPLYGKITNNGSIILQEFSYYDFLTNQIAYRHTSLTTEVFEKLAFIIYTQDLHVPFVINLNIKEDLMAPKMEIISTLFVIEGIPALLSSWNMKATQSIDKNGTLLIEYLILEAPKFGVLTWKEPETGMLDSSESIFRFPQNAVDSGQVVYKTAIPNHQTDRFRFNITNGLRTVGAYQLNVRILPRKVDVIVTSVEISQGKSFNIKELISVRPDVYDNIELNFRVVQKPMHGLFALNKSTDISQPGVEMSFPVSWNETPDLYYIHDNTDFTTDLIVFQLENSTLGFKTDHQVLTVRIKPIDKTPPSMVSPGEWKIVNGQSCVITPQVLQATDSESLDLDLVYVVKEVTSGSLVLSEGATTGKNGWEMSNSQKVMNFTQRQINNGDVVFQHSYSNDPLTSGSFAEIIFSVSDGVNALLDQYLRIFPQPLQLVSVQQNDFISIHPGVTQTIPSELLAVSTNDNCFDQYIFKYEILKQPRIGRIRVSDSSIATGFSKSDLISGNVGFFAPWSNYTWPQIQTIDFEVSIQDKLVSPLILRLRLKLDFNTLNERAPSPLITNQVFTVYQRELTYISRRELDASNLLYHELSSASFPLSNVQYLLTTIPREGFIGSKGIQITSFTQFELNANQIYYNHTKKSPFSNDDFFRFNVTVPKRSGSGTLVFQGPVFNILIVNRNHPFAPVDLRTRSPKLEVVQQYFAIVDSSVLLAKDKDTNTNMIEYSVISKSLSGYFALVYDPQTEINSFTQSDVDNNMVAFYVKSDTLEPMSFDMSVRDLISQLNPNTQVSFTFLVQPVQFRLETLGSKIVELEQGDWSTAISKKTLSVFTNANPDDIALTVFRRPQNGDLEIDGRTLYEFDKFGVKDVENSQLKYTMQRKENTKEFDQFRLELSYNGRTDYRQFVNIDVRILPLFSTSTLYLQPNSSISLTTTNLNATLLSKKTGKISIFKITQGPKFGYLWDAKRKSQIFELDYFDGNSVAEKQIEFYARDLPEDVEEVRDEVGFKVGTSYNSQMMSTPSAQWVTGKLAIVISTTPYLPSTPQGAVDSSAYTGAGNKDLIAILIPVTLFLILFCLIGVFLARRQQRKRHMPSRCEKSPGSMATPVEYSKNGMFMPLSNARMDSNSQQFPLLGLKESGPTKTGGGPIADEIYIDDKLKNQTPSYINAMSNDFRDPSPQNDRFMGGASNGGTFSNSRAGGYRNAPINETDLTSSDYNYGSDHMNSYNNDWNGMPGSGGGYIEDAGYSGYRDPQQHMGVVQHPTIKAVVRVDSRGHIETRTVPVVDEYDKYSPRSHYDLTLSRSPNIAYNNNNNSNITHTMPQENFNPTINQPSLRQSQYWL